MSNNTLTKKRRVINYLASGKGLTPAEARSRFGVANLRATISDIRELVEAYGNWQIVSEATVGGSTRYFMRSEWKPFRSLSEVRERRAPDLGSGAFSYETIQISLAQNGYVGERTRLHSWSREDG
jgi:hypothetical protein